MSRRTERNGGQLVVFALGADEYALPINKVQEIILFGQLELAA